MYLELCFPLLFLFPWEHSSLLPASAGRSGPWVIGRHLSHWYKMWSKHLLKLIRGSDSGGSNPTLEWVDLVLSQPLWTSVSHPRFWGEILPLPASCERLSPISSTLNPFSGKMVSVSSPRQKRWCIILPQPHSYCPHLLWGGRAYRGELLLWNILRFWPKLSTLQWLQTISMWRQYLHLIPNLPNTLDERGGPLKREGFPSAFLNHKHTASTWGSQQAVGRLRGNTQTASANRV